MTGTANIHERKIYDVLDCARRRLYYRAVIKGIRKQVRKLGYAIGEHGSLERDIDIIAVAWSDDHAMELQLIAAIIGLLEDGTGVTYNGPHLMPCGRHGYLIFFEWNGQRHTIDLGVVGVHPSKAAQIVNRSAPAAEEATQNVQSERRGESDPGEHTGEGPTA